MSQAVRDLHLELPPADVRLVDAPIPLWQVVCSQCGCGSRPCQRISEALGEWLDHLKVGWRAA